VNLQVYDAQLAASAEPFVKYDISIVEADTFLEVAFAAPQVQKTYSSTPFSIYVGYI
jgi:hypothetical protein